MTKSHIKASLRVWHPSMPAQNIYKSINLKLVRKWSYGEQRTTPKGKPLEGAYKETYCCFELAKNASQDISNELISTNEELSRSAKIIEEIMKTGGRIEYYISFSAGAGLELNHALISNLSALKIGLSIEAL
ncbi:hypothetical protein [Pseudomonas aeruginosa]|uniref:hypothetical protein n=1 Tax=Pseudomonas aeruginosa TaxID=287 RepID=UPI0018AB4375|nr:hypothetical protein [Pseudomonas aeruginosa]MBF8798069.1 hypothetical protein [Pseudomonas aeruginosa]MDV7846047.1 hypothetical protein [Pseudomonas aeruginosa]